MDSVRARKSKFVCINDDLRFKSEEMDQAIHVFYESFFPTPSQFEKPQPSRHLDWEPILSSVLHNFYVRQVAKVLALFCGTFLFLFVMKWEWGKGVRSSDIERPVRRAKEAQT